MFCEVLEVPALHYRRDERAAAGQDTRLSFSQVALDKRIVPRQPRDGASHEPARVCGVLRFGRLRLCLHCLAFARSGAHAIAVAYARAACLAVGQPHRESPSPSACRRRARQRTGEEAGVRGQTGAVSPPAAGSARGGKRIVVEAPPRID
eukprot:scaffold14040_cov31-Tisochrysis_lutea.AAC.4